MSYLKHGPQLPNQTSRTRHQLSGGHAQMCPQATEATSSMRRAVNLSKGETVARCISNSWQNQHRDMPGDRDLLAACALRHLWVPLCVIMLFIAVPSMSFPPAIQPSRWSGGRQPTALGKTNQNLVQKTKHLSPFGLTRATTYVCSVVVDPSLAVIHAYKPGAAAYEAETRRGKGPWYGSSAGNDRTLLGPASSTASLEVQVPSYATALFVCCAGWDD